jgi:hypothetical protein
MCLCYRCFAPPFLFLFCAADQGAGGQQSPKETSRPPAPGRNREIAMANSAKFSVNQAMAADPAAQRRGSQKAVHGRLEENDLHAPRYTISDDIGEGFRVWDAQAIITISRHPTRREAEAARDRYIAADKRRARYA